MGNQSATWIDIPVIQAMEFFSGVLVRFYNWGAHYALAIGTIGLCWSAFRLANSRFTLRDFWWDTLYKWVLYILFMSIYPTLTIGISSAANKIGINAGCGKQAIIDSLTSMKRSIEYDINTGYLLEEELNEELKGVLSKSENITFETSFGQTEDYDQFMDKFYDEVNSTRFRSKDAKKKALDLINEYREKNKYHSLFSKKTLQAIKDILVEKLPDGTDGDSLLEEYVDLNIWLKNAEGNDTHYLSPGSIMRVTLLGCQILWEKNQIAYAIDLDEIEEEQTRFIKRNFSKLSATMAHIPVMIMTMFCCIVLVFSGIFACIQYVMTILEYTIITGIGAFFIPFLLFDGTKEIPKKLIPVFTGLFIKIIVITICMFYVFYIFIQQTVEIISDNGGMNWVTVASILFNCIIAFILTQNAPKIAMTILTGQPQLSMGEFMTAAGSLAMGTMKGSKMAGRMAKEGTRKTAQGAVNTHGAISKIRAAGKAAAAGMESIGASKDMQKKAMSKGMYAAVTQDLKDKIHNAGNNFLHGGNSGKSGMGNGRSGNQAYQRSGQNTSREVGENSSRTLNSTSNPKFQTATRFDEATSSNVNMKRSEFYEEKRNQGKNIGNAVFENLADLTEKNSSRKIKKNIQNKLPDNLTGNERET